MALPRLTAELKKSAPNVEWLNLFKGHAANGEEVDLVSFNCDYDIGLCERIANRHGMTFRTDPERETAFLRKLKSPPS